MTLKGLKLQVIMHSKKKIIFEYMFGDFPFWREHKESRRLALGCFTTIEMVLYKIHWTIKI